MTDAKSVLSAIQRHEDLYVTRHHAQWLELTEEEQAYSPAAVSFVRNALQNKYKKPRGGRFSPSQMGRCQRESLFTFDGAPKVGANLDSYELMGLGTWGHLRWQAEGLTAGWMKKCEVFVHDEGLRLGGSIDAVLADGSVFELKTVASSRYTKIIREGAPMEPHALQTEIYMMLLDTDKASIVYEERSTGRFTEYRVSPSKELRSKALDGIQRLNAYADLRQLPQMLDSCEMRVGSVFQNCDYRVHCHQVEKEMD